MIKALHGILLASCAIALLTASAMGGWLAYETICSERKITASVVGIPGMADAQLNSIKWDALSAIDEHARRLEAILTGATGMVDGRLASFQKDTVGQLGTANKSIATMTGAIAAALPAATSSLTQSIARFEKDVHTVAEPAGLLVAQVNDQAPLFLDCQFNPDCVFNRYQGLSKAAEQTFQAIAKAAPEMSESAIKIEKHVDHIAGAAEKEADAITRPRKWYEKAATLGVLGLATAARVFF